MADAALLRKAAMKVVYLGLVVGVGEWLLWPDEPVREWLQTNVDWKLKFAFLAWAAVSVGMAYDTVLAMGRGIMASPDTKRR